VEFVVTDQEAERLIELFAGTGLRAFYARIPAAFGILSGS
jgi:hypothetical protein